MDGIVAAVSAEWTKFRSVRSTFVMLSLVPTVAVGLSVLIGLSYRSAFATLPPEQQATFDPIFATFYSLTLGQLGLVVFAVLTVTSEYGSGTIRASLMAVPRRGRWYSAKVVTVTVTCLGVSLPTVLATMVASRLAMGPMGTSVTTAGAPTAIAGACLYLPLISLFALGVATMLRSSVVSLAILLPLLFLGSQGLGNVPGVKVVTQYLPDQAGSMILHLAGPQNDPRWARGYGPWGGIGILALWAVLALLGGLLALRRRDA